MAKDLRNIKAIVLLKDFANKKKGDVLHLNTRLASQIIAEGVAKEYLDDAPFEAVVEKAVKKEKAKNESKNTKTKKK